jgi:hypothetical protein
VFEQEEPGGASEGSCVEAEAARFASSLRAIARFNRRSQAGDENSDFWDYPVICDELPSVAWSFEGVTRPPVSYKLTAFTRRSVSGSTPHHTCVACFNGQWWLADDGNWSLYGDDPNGVGIKTAVLLRYKLVA